MLTQNLETASSDVSESERHTLDSDTPKQEFSRIEPHDASQYVSPVANSQTSDYDHGLSKDLSESKIALARKLLSHIMDNVQKIERLLTLEGDALKDETHFIPSISHESEIADEVITANSERIVEGVFDGSAMIGQDGKEYSVPPNYASKSKLVEGDILKLTINRAGSFVYKQIGPIERRRVIATLDFDSVKNQYTAIAEDKSWKLLTASVTYYKGEKGDEVIILVPKASHSNWAAVENVIKQYHHYA